MKKLILSASAMALLFTACKKDDDNNGGGGSSNTFKIGSSTYTSVNVIAASNGGVSTLSASDASGNGFAVLFTALPTASGTYTITDGLFPTSANEVTLMATRASDTTSFFATGTPAQTVNVTVSGGKISVTTPTVWAKELFATDDSVQISANIKQTN